MNFQTTPTQRVQLYQIASEMKQTGLSDQFIVDAVQLGVYYEGMYDLFILWLESDTLERNEIVSDMQEEIDEETGQPGKRKLQSCDPKCKKCTNSKVMI